MKCEIVNQIIHGDCLEVMRDSMVEESYKSIVTSPPFNLRQRPSGRVRLGYGLRNKQLLTTGYDQHGDCMGHEAYCLWQKECLAEMWRLLRPDGAIFYNHIPRISDGVYWSPMQDILTDLPVRQVVVWDKGGSLAYTTSFFAKRHQYIFFIPKPECRLVPPTQYCGDVWRFNAERNIPSHPAPFPVDLPLRCLEAMGPGPVLDPFAGSGTTGVAAAILGKKYPYTLIEISEKYCRLAAERTGLTHPHGALFSDE